MRNISLKQLKKDLKKIAPPKRTRRTHRFGLNQKKVRGGGRIPKQVEQLPPVKKSMNWKKIGAYTLGGLGVLGAGYALSTRTKKGQQLTNQIQSIKNDRIHVGKNSERKKSREMANEPYKKERETKAKIENLKNKKDLNASEKKEKERLEKLLIEQQRERIKNENLPELTYGGSLFDFGVKRKYKKTLVRTHVRNVPLYNPVKKIRSAPPPTPEKKKFNYKKIGAYTLAGLGLLGAGYAASRRSSTNENLKKGKKEKVVQLPITQVSEREKQLQLEIDEIERKMSDIDLPQYKAILMQNTIEKKKAQLNKIRSSSFGRRKF